MKKLRPLMILLLFTSISLFLWNCEQEERLEIQEVQQSTIRKVDRHVVSGDIFKRDYSNAFDIVSKLSENSFSTDRTYSAEHDLYYTLDNVYIIEEEGYQQFSFLVKSSNQLENQFENYLLNQYSDGSSEQFVITYEYTSIDQQSYDYVGIRKLEGNNLYTSRIGGCDNLPQLSPVTVEVCTFTDCTGVDGTGSPQSHGYGGGDCSCGISVFTCSAPSRECTTETQWVMSCGGSGNDSGTDDGTNNDDNDNPDGGGGGPDDGNDDPNDDDDILVIPVVINYAADIISCINLSESATTDNTLLSQSQLDWVNNNASQRNLVQVNDFLNSNSCSEEAQEFAIEAIEALMNGGEVDYEDKIIITSSVPECVKTIINKLKSDNAYVDLGDMPDFVKEELNLSGTIMDVFNNSDNYHINFKVGNIPLNSQGQQPNANTEIINNITANGNVYFNITLDSNYIINATDLSISRSIIHESLHAYISYIYQTEIFSDLSNSLRHLLSQSGDDQNSAQHMLMAEIFVDSIASALATWDENSINNSEYYNYLSWSGGMQSTPAFSNLTSAYQQNCINANIAEQTNSSSAVGQKNCN